MTTTVDATRAVGGAAPRPSALRTFSEVLVGRVGTAVLSLTSIVLVARTAPTAEVGIYTAAMGFALLLFMFLDLGSGQALVRSAAADSDEHQEIWLYLRTRATLTVLTATVGCLLVPVLFPVDARPAALLGMIVVLFSFAGPLAPVGQVIGRVRPYRNVLLLQGVVSMALTAVALFVLGYRTAVPLVAASAVGSVVGSVVAAVWLARSVPPVVLRGWTAIGPHLRTLALLGLATGLGSVYGRIDNTLVLRLVGTTDAAYYGIATRIIDQARIVPSTLLIPLGTVLAAMYATRIAPSRPEARWLIRLGVLIGTALTLALTASSTWATLIIGGHEYDDAARLVIVLGLALGVSVVGYVVVLCAIMAGEDRLYLSATAISLVLSVGANLVLLPAVGTMGAACTTIATQFCLMSVLLGSARFAGLRRPVLNGLGAMVVVAVAAVVCKLGAAHRGPTADAIVSLALLAGAAAVGWRGLRLLNAAPTSEGTTR